MSNIFFNISKIRIPLLIAGLFCYSLCSYGQKPTPKSIPPPVVVPDTSKINLLLPVVVKDTGKNVSSQSLTLQQCIDYALQHQPALNIALINIDVAKTTNAINLAGALPQVNSSGSLIHNIQEASNASNPNVKPYTNTFVPGVAVSQAIFNPSLIYAYKSAPLYNEQARQARDSTKILLVDAVSKAFYNLLLTLEQINVLKGDTAEFGKSYRDAYHQYIGGIVDETDYEEAQITLNNTIAQLKQATENVIPQYATLKQDMGFPPEQQFNVVFDTLEMMKNIHIDTTEQLQYEKRIEYQLLNTNKNLQLQLIDYYRYSWFPTVSAIFNYNLTYENNRFSDLLSTSYPASYIGLSFTIPIFTGFSRINNLHKARLQEQILDWNQTNLKSQIYTEYTTALSNYKGNYYNLQLLQKNVALSRRVYFVVELQYKQGIVPYLNVITAQSNLITSEINYLNSLFQVLSNKIDLEKAMGNIPY
jgi:outer membrane protein TolC